MAPGAAFRWTAFQGDLLLQLDDRDLARLAERLRPLIAPSDDGWLRGAGDIAMHLGCPVSRVYALSSAGRIPLEHDGSALVGRRSTLDTWVRNGGGRRP